MCSQVVHLVFPEHFGSGGSHSRYFPAPHPPPHTALFLSKSLSASVQVGGFVPAHRHVCCFLRLSAFFLGFVAVFTVSGRFLPCPDLGPVAWVRSSLTSVSLVNAAHVYSAVTAAPRPAWRSHIGPCWAPSANGSFPRGPVLWSDAGCAFCLAGRRTAQSPRPQKLC